MVDKLTNKPVTPSDEMLELLKDWVAPDVTESKKAQIVGKTNFLGVPIEEMYSRLEKAEAEEEEEEVPQLTAEEIEQIRKEAYDEGFALGKEEGLEKGHEEGLQQGHEEGVAQGLDVGLQQGLEQGQIQIQQQVEHWQKLIGQLYEPIARVDEAVELQLVDLAVMLAEAVIRTESKCNLDSLLQVLNESITALPFNTEYAELHLHPDDILLLQTTFDEEALAERNWILKEEPSYNPGDLMVATPNSLIDRTVKHRIQQTIKSFIDSVGLNKEQIKQPGNLSISKEQSNQEKPQETSEIEDAIDENEVAAQHDVATADSESASLQQSVESQPEIAKENEATQDETGAEDE